MAKDPIELVPSIDPIGHISSPFSSSPFSGARRPQFARSICHAVTKGQSVYKWTLPCGNECRRKRPVSTRAETRNTSICPSDERRTVSCKIRRVRLKRCSHCAMFRSRPSVPMNICMSHVVPVGQLADYIAVVGLAEIKLDRELGDAPTILHLKASWLPIFSTFHSSAGRAGLQPQVCARGSRARLRTHLSPRTQRRCLGCLMQAACN
jgi:hypothetical protein